MTEKKIIVLGPGCPRCEQLVRVAGRAAEELGIKYHLEKLSDFREFQKYGLMMTRDWWWTARSRCRARSLRSKKSRRCWRRRST
jgi:hypothetical protein